jgi:hypothetical protein
VIDIQKEKVFSLTQAAKSELLPRRRFGKRPNVATFYRWAQRGVRGVALETLQIGGTKCTSAEALQRFFELLGQPQPTITMPESARRREASIQQALRDLAA